MSIGWSLRSFRACLSNLPLSPHKHISFASLISAHWILGYAHTRAMQISIGVGVIVDYLAPDFGSGWHTTAIEPRTEGDEHRVVAEQLLTGLQRND